MVQAGTALIPVEEARARILDALAPVPAETIGLDRAVGRVLAADATARRTQPPGALSAMDGYALRAADVAQVPVRLEVIGEAAAGSAFAGRIEPGQAVRIFTGAPLPAGADAVVIQEDTTGENGWVEVHATVAPGRHVRPEGIDFRAGDVGLCAGTLLTPQDIALAAAMNLPWLSVRRRPRVALLSTGDELVRPGEPIGPDQIVSANAPALAALVRAAGGEPLDLGIAPDRPEAIRDHARGAAGADLLVTIGGASVGAHDLVQPALAEMGLAVAFWRIAMRPGKPLMFGRLGAIPVLGLPGNPVSALVCALVFLRPALWRLLGRSDAAEICESALLGRDLPANDRRQDYLRARRTRDAQGRAVVTPCELQDSSVLSVLAAADCLLIRPPHAPAAAAGSAVPILPLR